MAQLDRQIARDVFRACGIDPRKTDFHSLNTDQVDCVLRFADLRRYRKPVNANGSRARYFFAYVCRRANNEDRD